MKQSIKFHKYSINFEKAPNSQTTNGEVEGALIKINGGHACIQPWKTLGDNDLEYHLESIASNKPTDIGLKIELEKFSELFNSDETFEGLSAFIEKRPPKY